MPAVYISTVFLLLISQVSCEDQHCVNMATKEIDLELGADNPQRVLTYAAGEPCYQRNLQCKWILKAANYDQPRQMYIQVPVVDFDANSATQCSSSDADVFTMTLKLNESKTQTESWCSDKSVKIKQQIVNLWDSSFNLTVEFRSDNEQVRSDAKGLQMDVQVLDRDYCHKRMLYLNGSCYLVTPEQLTLADAYQVSRNFLGNVFVVPADQEVTRFLKRFFENNSKRAKDLPFASPLALLGRKLWTGYLLSLSGVDPPAPGPAQNYSVEFFNAKQNCNVSRRQIDVSLGSSLASQSGANQCGLALEWKSNDTWLLTCESTDLKLPALIQFNQIPETKDDLHPQLFRTCEYLPTSKLKTWQTRSCQLGCIISIGAAVLSIVLVIVIFFVLICRACRREDSPWQEFVVGAPEMEPLKA